MHLVEENQRRTHLVRSLVECFAQDVLLVPLNKPKNGLLKRLECAKLVELKMKNPPGFNTLSRKIADKSNVFVMRVE